MGNPFAPAALSTFGLIDVELGILEVHVLDAEVQWFGHAHSAAIEQVDDQPGGIPIDIGDGSEQSKHFLLSGAVPGVGLAFGPEGIDWFEFLFEDIAIKEQHGVERLVLR